MTPSLITKFGGTSVSTRENWEHIVSITRTHQGNGFLPIVVCSALSGASNQLEALVEAALLNEHQANAMQLQHSYFSLADALEVSRELISYELQQLNQWLTGIALLKEAPAKTRAQLLSLGELMMTRLGHAFLEKNGFRCLWYDARQALCTIPMPGGDTVNFLAARCEGIYNPKLAEHFAQSGAEVIITQGFIAANPQGETVLLGRGGSDTSGALFASTLKASACEIWTDVPGIYTANPHQLPNARLLKQLNYDEAQEIASMGAKVLHPNCLPPVKHANIPMFVKFTKQPKHSGTRISEESDTNAPQIKSIQVKRNITLISIDTLHMWQQVGFLADVFAAFKLHGFSVDLLSSSEFNITLSLDNHAKLRGNIALHALLTDLNTLGRVKIIEPCSAVSLVGQNIRMVLPQLGPTLAVFEAQQVYLMSLASNDLNLTFVVDEEHADKLCQKLHTLLIESNPQSFYYSKSWQEEFGDPHTRALPWWETQREQLLQVGAVHSPCYVYHSQTQTLRAQQLRNLQSIDALFYAIKANPHPKVLETLEAQGMGFECVSINELEHVLALFPNIERSRILFTPNFSAKKEYEFALKQDCFVTVDSLYPLEHWPDLFRHHAILLRVDPGSGSGHHKYVCTGGNESKFGIPRNHLQRLSTYLVEQNIRVIGLHAHSGSGILTPDVWQKTALMLAEDMNYFPDVKIINLGGGLGVVERPGQQPLDLKQLDNLLLSIKSSLPSSTVFWLEPGRFLVAESGVILAKVTQCKEKEKVRFIGIETGMNSLLRPALYSAYHDIVNLSRLGEEKTGFAHVVGPICESGDTLGYDRLLPDTQEGDLILIANTGAYGHCMSSSYNLRPPAEEIFL